jgi:hypothetical protein
MNETNGTNGTKIRGLSRSDLNYLVLACFWAADYLTEIRHRLFVVQVDEEEAADFLKVIRAVEAKADALTALGKRLNRAIDSEPEA